MITQDRSPETDAERKGRQLRMLRDLAETGMRLAFEAAEDASATQANPSPGAGKPSPAAHPALRFEKLSRDVQRVIALEARISNGLAPTRAQATTAATADTRRAPLLRAFEDVTRLLPNRNALRRSAAQRLDTELLLDPDRTVSVVDLFSAICEELDIAVDVSELSDDVLDLLTPEGADPAPDISFDDLLRYSAASKGIS